MIRSSPPSELRQVPAPLPRYFRGPGQSPLRLTPAMGTNGSADAWAVDPSSSLALTLAAQSVYFIRGADRRPFRWYSRLPARGLEAWEIGADAAYSWSYHLPYEERNWLAFSDGGQVIWRLAASGVTGADKRPIVRSVTFVGTPNRKDVGSAEAIKHIAMAQVIYDADADPIAWLGALFGGYSRDRSFAQLDPPMRRYGVHGIGHGGVLNDQRLVRLWETEPWIRNMREAPAAPAKETV